MKIIGREETAKRAEFLRTQKLKKKKRTQKVTESGKKQGGD